MEITEPLNEIEPDTKALKSVEDVDASKVGCTESIFSYDFASVSVCNRNFTFILKLSNLITLFCGICLACSDDGP